MSHSSWLPRTKVGPMISGMAPLRRAVTAVLAASLLVGAAVRPAWAQGAESGWFNDSGQPGGAPPGAPVAAPQGGPAVPAAPAAPAAPGVPGEPLPASPMLDGGQAPAPPAAGAEDQDPRALTAWNSHLDPYGTWRDDPRYGRVWVPSPSVVGTDFAPYSTGGRWVLDESNQWTWASDYPFGWVTFHYGRWVWIGGTGWAWIPGMTYAPAWVAWRVPTGTYAYVGWAPLPPAYVWFGGFAVWYPYYPIYPWVFCPSEYVFYPHVHHYVVHDHYGMAYAAHYTRPYVPATPHPGAHATAAPHGPSPQAARVPAKAVPMERVSSRAITARGSAVTSAHGYPRQLAQGDAHRQAFGQSGAMRALPQSALMRSSAVSSTRAQPMAGGGPSVTRSSRPASAQNVIRSAPVSSAPMSSVRAAPRVGSSPRMESVRAAPRLSSSPRMESVRAAPRSWGGGHFGGGSRMGGSHFGGGARMGSHAGGFGHGGGGRR